MPSRTIIQGNCINELIAMPKDSVDLIVASPPYNCRIAYNSYQDELSWADYYWQMKAAFAACCWVLRPGGTIAINVPPVIHWQRDHAHADTWADYDPDYETHSGGTPVTGKARIEPIGFRLFDLMETIGFKMREPIVWIKGSSPEHPIALNGRMGSDSDPVLRSCYELILLGSKGEWFHRGGTGRRGAGAVPFDGLTKDVWNIQPAASPDHPAPFPVELPERLIRLFCHAPDAVVCDPFMGIGTTGEAAARCGLDFIGIDIDPTYCEIARRQPYQMGLF